MSGAGRPIVYKREHASRARDPEFAEAVQHGLDFADAIAVESLFTRNGDRAGAPLG